MAITASGCGKGARRESDIVTVALDEPLPAGVSAEALHVALGLRSSLTPAPQDAWRFVVSFAEITFCD